MLRGVSYASSPRSLGKELFQLAAGSLAGWLAGTLALESRTTKSAEAPISEKVGNRFYLQTLLCIGGNL